MKRFITKCCPASGIYNFNVGNPVVGSIKLRRNIEAYLLIDETLCARRFDRCEYLRSILCCHLHKTTFLEHILNYTMAYSKPRGFFKTHFNIFFPSLYTYFSWSGSSDHNFVCFSSMPSTRPILLIRLDTHILFMFGSFIHSFSSLSYDRSKASSKASSPHSAIQSFLLQMRIFSFP
jgi:hypothetical protein